MCKSALKKVWKGYRDEVDLVFRMDSGYSGSKVNWNARRTRELERCSAPSIHDLPEKNLQHLLPGIAQPLVPSQSEQPLCYFYEYMISTMPDSDILDIFICSFHLCVREVGRTLRYICRRRQSRTQWDR
jgi:hypothetical protein